jgi:hypothetical protein
MGANLTRANDLARRLGQEGGTVCPDSIQRTTDEKQGIAGALRGELGRDWARSGNVAVTAALSPACALCRALIAASHAPDLPLVLYRGEVPALIVRSLAEGAAVEASGLGFIKWFPRDNKGRRLAA